VHSDQLLLETVYNLGVHVDIAFLLQYRINPVFLQESTTTMIDTENFSPDQECSYPDCNTSYYSDPVLRSPGVTVEGASRSNDAPFHRLRHVAGRIGMEQRGIEPVPEEERSDTYTFKVGTMVSSILTFLHQM
jgi:hypothetical protein